MELFDNRGKDMDYTTRNAMRATSNWTGRFPRTAQEAFGSYTKPRRARRIRTRRTDLWAFLISCLICSVIGWYAFLVVTR